MKRHCKIQHSKKGHAVAEEKPEEKPVTAISKQPLDPTEPAKNDPL